MSSELPVKQEEKSLSLQNKKILKNISDVSKRAGKAFLGVGGLCLAAVVASGASALSIPVIPTIALVRRSLFWSKRNERNYI
jgi:hypothetical protein